MRYHNMLSVSQRLASLWLAFVLICTCLGSQLTAQNNCGPEEVIDSNGFSGTAFFNYGSTARAKSQTYRATVAIGQTFVGFTEDLAQNSTIGFFSRFLLPPFALKVKATQGDLLDRIQVSWEIDALGPSPNDGFNIYRDGVFLATVGSNVRNYNDFNVIAGKPYIYTVTGLNIFGEGTSSEALGFQVPNGVVTGWVSTLSGSPVPGALVTLTPMQGFSAKFGATHGAFALSEEGNPFLPPSGEDWTMTFWMKTEAASDNASVIHLQPGPLYLRAVNSSSGNEGLEVALSANGTPFLSGIFPDSTKNDWHHIGLSYDGNSDHGRLYIDGALVALGSMSPISSPDSLKIAGYNSHGTWNGQMDELRIYHHMLDELDFGQIMMATASSQTPFLSHYWKMDEELGEKSYDIVNRHKLYFCGSVFDADRPPVHTAGVTNVEGYYQIESASYGTGTTFLAKAHKDFFMHRSLKFNHDENDLAIIPDFELTPKATIELWVNSAGPDGTQYLISKQWNDNDFHVRLEQSGLNNNLIVEANNQPFNVGVLGNGFQHLAFTWDSAGSDMDVYLNGGLMSSLAFTLDGNWSDPAHDWILGEDFGGLIDELAIYDTTLTQVQIQEHVDQARNSQENGLRIYFPFDEGNGNQLGNMGSAFIDGGTTAGTEWSSLAAHQETSPHLFTPATRQVTLNPSVTSVDQVDFTDRSTIAVTGFVRYKDTDCFEQNVEIYVNGASYQPPIFTDSTGRFVIDFDPGASAILSPKFEDHVFSPSFWDIPNVSTPTAGIVFNDVTTRTVSGQVAGGHCRKSIITAPPGQGQGTFCVVKIRTADGCFERQITIDNQEGFFEFEEVPPFERLTVAVVEHSNPAIKTAFQVQGGSTVNLTKRDTMIDFIYTAIPEIEIVSGLEPYSPNCDAYVFEQFENVELQIKLKEQYVPIPEEADDGICYIDTASFHIINGFGDEVHDTTMGNGVLVYEFVVGTPNPSPPHQKNLTIIGTTLDGNDVEFTTLGIVTGLRSKDNTFTTVLPETPSLILRDPPGDGSYSFLEKNEKFCQQMSFTKEITTGTGASTVLDLGPDIDIGPFFGVQDLEFTSNIGFDITALNTISKVDGNTIQVCTSLSERISTSEDDLIVGGEHGGDVYVGGGLNIEFGFADIVSFDTTTCSGVDSVTVMVVPGDYATTFMYSEWGIRSNELVYLQNLADLTTDTVERNRYLESIDRWNTILEDNAAQKAAARFVRNISFDAGASYEYAETSDTATTETEVVMEGFVREVNFNNLAYVIGLGGGLVIKVNYSDVNGRETTGSNEKGITTGYVLKDDDPLDQYTIDVCIDSVYKTPVFNLKAGQSSCPWEPGTAKREGVLLTSVDGPFRTDVPANEPASYQFIMHNISATNETWTYAFTAGPESNPHSAKIFCNGAPMNQIQWYAIPWGTSLPVTVTMERGPVEYDYDSLEIVLYSACEDQRANDLGILPDTAQNLYSAVYISAHFIRPCSEVNINVPEQDWVLFPDPLTPGSDDERRITVSGYNLDEPDFQLIRVQYRPSDGDGAWINIPGISDRYNPNWYDFANVPGNPPVLNPDFTNFFWETTGLADGPYEIRAVAVCTGDAVDRPGYSQVIKGRIDREAPSLVGVPQPSDGVLHVGDEISFTFNQDVNCNMLIQADQFDENNVGLYDATTNTLIDANITCVGNKIVIDPLFDNTLYENHIMRAELHNIEDLTGNVLLEEEWEFYVDRNELAWLTDSAGITKYEDEVKSVSVKVHNRGGYPVPFTITDVPDWVHVSPDAGTLVPNEIREITFTAQDTLGLGWFADSVVLHTEIGQNPFFMGGDEALPFAVRNICRPPNWFVNPALYQNTMTIATRLRIEGVFSSDPEDQIGVFIDGQLRGTAKLTFVPSTGQWVAFITVYGNSGDAGKSLVFEIFDASECLHYPANFTGAAGTFSSNGIQGTPSAPRIVTTNNLLLHEIPLKTGWNWISFNLRFPDPAIGVALSNIPNPNNDLIKNQTKFSTYTNSTWSGSLTALGNASMYMYQATKDNTLKISGEHLAPETLTIPILQGWNWISYAPTTRLPVDAALASLGVETNGVIKSQTEFAQYVDGVGWVGSLKYMEAPNGYLLRGASSGSLTYPAGSLTGDNPVRTRDREAISTFWNIEPTLYEFNMTLIGMFRADDVNATTADMELGAFVGNEIRGVATPVYIEYLDAWLFFLTCYANTGGEQFRFKLYDATTGDVHNLQERLIFSPNGHDGSVQSPIPFSLQTTGVEDVSNVLFFDVSPNPFRDEMQCRFVVPVAHDVRVSIYATDGKQVFFREMEANAGMNTMTWNGCAASGTQLSNGIYVLRLETENGIVTSKVVLQR